MAKRRRRRKKKENAELITTLYAVLLVILSILGFGKFGPAGRLVYSMSLFFVGKAAPVLLGLSFIIGIYAFIKQEWPDFFSTKMLGLYLLGIGVLTLLHWNFAVLNDNNSSLIFRVTINQLTQAFKDMMTYGKIGETITIGGGLIGGVFTVAFDKLFSYVGMQIVTIFLITFGTCMFTGFSIVEFIRNGIDNVKEKIELAEEDDDEEEEEEKTKKVKISNGNEPEEIEKQTVNSIEDIKKLNNPQQAPVKEETEPAKETYVNPSYKLPPITLLNQPKNRNAAIDNASIEANIEKLERVLRSFQVEAKVVEVHVGPTVAQYELEIASGTRVNKITTLSREIALALSKKDVRIEAPIPGKNTVGVEFANDKPNSVSFYEIMDSKEMKQNPDKLLMVPLGRSIMGEIGVCEINKMPHLLIAGTTGSGKSVCVNGIICSILMRAKPDEVKLAMVDPKVVELSCYNGIPHLMCPVVSDPKQAAILLQKMVNEMEKRYHMFANTGTKKIEGYNEYVEKWNKNHPDEKLEKMPFVVIIIDELSDLMMVAAKEVEDSILRITQKARAAGIHLIVATQRPSTEVITGLIKANIPSRIAFAVGSGIDSRTILDQVGAEKLLGKGDMFFLPIGQNSPTRIQGSFITDDEIEKIINFTKKQQEASYIDDFMKLEETKEEKEEIDGDVKEASGDDELYNQIVDFVVKSQKASASLLQRKFKIGYNKAATMMDELEENGIIGPPTGNSKPREVLIQYSDQSKEE